MSAQDSERPESPLSCTSARVLVSAAADDELDAIERQLLAAHLDGCAECAAYAERLAVLTRAVRLRPVPADGAFAVRVLDRARPPRLGRGGWMRPALAWCGVVIAIQAIPQLVFGEVEGVTTHVARHVGAAALALAIGLLYAAWRPQRAFGLVPLVGALFAANLAGALFDTIDGTRSPFAESVHASELVGMVLLWLVAGSPGWDRVCDLVRHARPGGGLAHH